MDDYIKRADAVHALCKAVHKDDVDSIIPCENQTASCLWSGTRVCDYAKEIDALPSADVVEVVRCKDCKWSDWYTAVDGKQYCYCMETGASARTETDYCSYGERQDGEQNG